MILSDIIEENFQTVSINGILYSMSSDERDIYNKIKNSEDKKLFKDDLNEFDQRVANNMVSKGILQRRKNKDKGIYFATKGRRKIFDNQPLDEVAPPDSEIEKWIGDNKQRFIDKYGSKKYKKYLYGKAWNKFNSKKINESITHNKKEFGNSGMMYDDYDVDLQEGMRYIDDKGVEWMISKMPTKGDRCLVVNRNGDEKIEFVDILKDRLTALDKYKFVYDPRFFSEEDLKIK